MCAHLSGRAKVRGVADLFVLDAQRHTHKVCVVGIDGHGAATELLARDDIVAQALKHLLAQQAAHMAACWEQVSIDGNIRCTGLQISRG